MSSRIWCLKSVFKAGTTNYYAPCLFWELVKTAEATYREIHKPYEGEKEGKWKWKEQEAETQTPSSAVGVQIRL